MNNINTPRPKNSVKPVFPAGSASQNIVNMLTKYKRIR